MGGKQVKMSDAKSFVKLVIEEAIRRERAAFQMYEKCAAEAARTDAKALLEALAADERKHERMLTEASSGPSIMPNIKQTEDLRVTDFMEDREIHPGSTFQEVLVFAAKKEGRSWKLYEALADMAEDAQLKAILRSLSAEEKSHKSRIEKLYDDVVYREM